ncbi:hypothetical protein CDV31_006345 [Fusarium ambrosium]|uniref:Major facilitator superfamily (MFS) profile domain-containing protein n=1 Tax=Fusarium ambrosium TaxID=131363 RepID=A0A428UDZ1_9HYPO|nr:hypothetical protein CDV31_006345 [Fusarium ambrosium]
MLRSDQKFDDKNSANATNIENASLEQGTGFEASRQTSTLAEILKNRRIVLWCLLLYLLPINYGYEMTMVGKLYAAPAFQRQFGQEYEGVWTIKTSGQQLLNSANTIGVFVSACLNGFISDYLGRKWVVVIASFICCAGVILQGFSFDVYTLFGGKLLGNMGVGLGFSLGPVFVAELAPESFRGLALAFMNTMIVLGQWANSLTIYGCSFRHDEWAWRLPLFVQVIPPGILLILSLLILPESPSWLMIHGKEEQALRALKIFEGKGVDAEASLEAIKRAVEMEKAASQTQKESSWRDCFKGPNLRRTIIVIMVFCGQQWVGVTFIAGYLPYYFSLAGVKNALGVAQGAFAIQLFGNVCSWPLVDRVGRRPLMVSGCFAIVVGLVIIGCINIKRSDASLKATVALITMWGFIYQATLGAITYSVGGETPSPRLRQKTLSIAIAISTSFTGLWMQVTPFLVNPDKANLGGKICFVFLGPSLIYCTYLFFCLPEMKGRSVEKLEEMFQERIPAREFRKYH